MQLVKHNDPILRRVCDEFDFNNPPFDPLQFSQDLLKCMYDSNGIGLAANQIGMPYRVFAMRGAPENFVCFSPRVVMPSEEMIELDEGCLSFPNVLLSITRPRHVRVRFQTPNGDVLTKQFTGMTARIFQHELEHLDGKLYLEHMSRFKLKRALDRARKMGQNYDGTGILKLAKAA